MTPGGSTQSTARAGEHRLAQNVIEELWFGDDDPERTEQEASRSLAAALGVATGLKPFPLVLSRALLMLQNPDESRQRVAAVLEQDPALASRLLRVANSALYAPTRPCGTVMEAVVRLGNRNVADMVAGIAVFGMFSDVQGLGLRVRDHCAGVAAIARILAVEWRHAGAENVFLAGLMHDIGRLLMMQAGEPRYEQMDPELLETPDRVHLLERELTGYDHAILGAHVITDWRLPPDVARAVAWHHQPGRAFAAGGDLGLVVALIRLADRIDAQAGRGLVPEPEFLRSLAEDESAQYAGFSGDVLGAMWAKLTRTRDEALSVLKG
ncbi:MAG TPA: HDOD domain-containing protein [Polyangiaceae bacterium]|nr:HDOD domain-containing protein [Polyangiaceae bacterium]